MTYPRACALGEITWSPKKKRNWEDFSERMVTHYQRLDQMGIRYFKSTQQTIGDWNPRALLESDGTLEIDLSSLLQEAGAYTVTFYYTKGAHGLHLYEASLLGDGTEIYKDNHQGFTGWKREKTHYRLHLPEYKEGTTYTLKARVAGAGGTDSFGRIFLSKEAPE
jgi:hexosaminidase